MPCTTLLVGRGASYDGSTMIARNDDSGGGHFTPKKFVVVRPDEQPRIYESVISHAKIELPDHPLRYTAVPNAVPGSGIWAADGINEANVGMTACETISANERVLGADPLLEEASGGIGEEDMVVLVLPYIRTAREGVIRLGALLEQYGTYEMNGIAFQDVNEIWYLETIGGHHWMARRVPDNACAVIPNELSIDYFDLDDAMGGQRENMCSADLAEFIRENHLDLAPDCRGRGPAGGPRPWGGPPPVHREEYCEGRPPVDRPRPDREHPPFGGPDRGHHPGPGRFPGPPAASCVADADETHAEEESGCRPPASHRILNARLAFGTHEDADHVYNTPRAWYMGRCLAPHAFRWDGPGADFTPFSDDIPWCIVPEHKVTVEDVKYILSSHYQDTPYDPYGSYGDDSRRGAWRSIGINRTDVLAILQIRPDRPEEYRALEWICFASNAFNTAVPFYANVNEMPPYLSCTSQQVSTESFYWAARLVAALADACVQKNLNHIEHYQQAVQSKGHALIGRYDRQQADTAEPEERALLRQQANLDIAAMLRTQTDLTLDRVLFETSGHMKNQYMRSDH